MILLKYGRVQGEGEEEAPVEPEGAGDIGGANKELGIERVAPMLQPRLLVLTLRLPFYRERRSC
jgi:hypothetical protein